MLSCEDCEKYLEPFVDQALEVKESLDVEQHLIACAPCADRVEAERSFRQFVRQHAVAPSLPMPDKRRIVLQAVRATQQETAIRPPRHTFQVRGFMMGLVTAAALLLLVFKPYFFASPADDMMQKFANEASITYGTYMTQRVPPEFVNGDDKIVTKWLNANMGYKLKMPCITDKATKLLGGRLCRLLDRKSAAMMYKRNGANLLLFAFKGGHIAMPEKYRVNAKGQEFYVRTISGRPVAMWNYNGMTYSMVGDMDHDDLVQVAKTIDYR
jgi:anti-sigma factor RsiW